MVVKLRVMGGIEFRQEGAGEWLGLMDGGIMWSGGGAGGGGLGLGGMGMLGRGE